MLCIVAMATAAMAQVRMPVLRVQFEGNFNPNMTEYLNGKMELTDEADKTVSLNAKFRVRGATARQYGMKPSFNMKLRTEDYSDSQDSTLLGLRSCSSWILDAMAIDRICMRNRVSFDVWNEYARLPYETSFEGRNGTVGRFVEVYINDRYYGIYCLTDRINRKLLDLKKVKDNGNGTVTPRGVLYKHGTQDIENQNEPSFTEDYSAATITWHNAWELTEPDGYPSLEAWQPLIEAYRQEGSMSYIRKYFHMENLAQYQILIMALGIADNWGNKNRYFSILNIQKDIDDPDPAEGARRKFILTPWDMDTSLGGDYKGSFYGGTYTVWPPADLSKNGAYPFSICMADPEYMKLLKACWEKERKGALSVAYVAGKMYTYRDLFLKSGAWERMTEHFDAQKNRPCYVKDLAAEVDLVVNWYRRRFAEMDEFFGIHEDAIQDVMAAGNDATYDLTGKKVDATRLAPGVYIRNGRKILR